MSSIVINNLNPIPDSNYGQLQELKDIYLNSIFGGMTAGEFLQNVLDNWDNNNVMIGHWSSSNPNNPFLYGGENWSNLHSLL